MRRARLSLIVSMVIFGTLAVFVRKIPLASGELALYRAVLAAVLIGFYLGAAGRRKGKDHEKRKEAEDTYAQELRRERILLLVSGIAMAFNWILLFQAYRYTTVSAATLSYYFAPVIVTVASPFLFHEKMTGRQIVCFLMSTAGVIMIVGVGGIGSSSSDLIGMLLGLGAAVLYAAVILLNKFIKLREGIERTFLQFLAAIIILIPYVVGTGGFHLGELGKTGWINLLIVGLFHTGVTYCLYFSSLKELKGQEAAILSYIDPMVAVVVSVLILGEPVTGWQIAGGTLILGFAIWNELGGSGDIGQQNYRIEEEIKVRYGGGAGYIRGTDSLAEDSSQKDGEKSKEN